MFVTSCSPGPNNILASHSGFNHGIKKTIPLMLWVIFGFTTMLAVINFGLINIFKLSAFSDPSLVQFMHRNLAYLILVFYLLILIKIYKRKLNNLFFPIKLVGFFLVISNKNDFLKAIKPKIFLI